jgi:hypothetical protein
VHAQAQARDTAAPKWTATGAAQELAAAEGAKSGGGAPAQTFIPFAGGPRDCLGQRLAMMEARRLLCPQMHQCPVLDASNCIYCSPIHLYLTPQTL